MKKQIHFTKIIPRVLSGAFDLLFIQVICGFILQYFRIILIYYTCIEFFKEANVGVFDFEEISRLVISVEFVNLVNTNEATQLALKMAMICMFLTYIGLIGVYFISFWRVLGTTPGKIIMRMKIVDSDDYDKKISLFQCIKRYLGYTLLFISVFSMLRSSRTQAIHDKFANSLVVKS